MNSSTIKRLIKHVMDENSEDEEVIKTFRAKPEWIKRFKELEEIAHQEALLNSKRTALRDGLWGQIHESLEIYGGHLRYNDETDEIEQLESKE